MKVKEENESWLKTQLKKRRSWHPVPSLHGKYGETMETVTDFIWGGAPTSLQMVTQP